MKPNVLLTGGAGYIGAHTYVALHAAGYNPIILDNFSNADHETTARLAQLAGAHVECIEGDLTQKSDLAAAFEKFDFAAVIHFAAYKAVEQSMLYPLSYLENNLVGLINLLGAMRDHGTNTIVFSSSAEDEKTIVLVP